MDKPMILVTGATGFIGRVLCRTLAEAGFVVRAGHRHAGLPADFPRRDGITGQFLDLDRPESLPAALEGVDVVVHAAYGDVAAMPTQLAGLLHEMTSAGVRRMIYFSSVAVYGSATGWVDEWRAPETPVDAYGRIKGLCENRLRDWAQVGRTAIVLRPGIVYGPQSYFWNDKLACRIQAGAWGTFGRQGEGSAALIHVRDLARAVAAAIDAQPAMPWLPLNITASDCPTWNGYFAAMADVLGVRLSEIPPVMQRLDAVRGGFAKLWRRAGVPGLERWSLAASPGELALFARKARYPNDLARKMLDWSPTADFRVELKAIHGGRKGAPSLLLERAAR